MRGRSLLIFPRSFPSTCLTVGPSIAKHFCGSHQLFFATNPASQQRLRGEDRISPDHLPTSLPGSRELRCDPSGSLHYPCFPLYLFWKPVDGAEEPTDPQLSVGYSKYSHRTVELKFTRNREVEHPD
ncbi:hypothetical protein H4582DRAFT_460063 [Lactarius indigo]|nr:hypothetical protein H4582DRAFT_460063 [Lactarius indigo]